MELEINKLYINEVYVEKSRFIAYFFPIQNKDDFINELNKIKKENPKARHYCYAYKFDNEIKFSDDGEPKGSAGRPILSVIENKNLINCAIIVVRFFGGVLLGSGRLLRTYLLSATSVVEKATLLEIVEEIEFSVEVEIDFYDIFKNYLLKHHFDIVKTVFNDKIQVVFKTPLIFKEDLQSLFYPKVKILDKKTVKSVKEEK